MREKLRNVKKYIEKSDEANQIVSSLTGHLTIPVKILLDLFR